MTVHEILYSLCDAWQYNLFIVIVIDNIQGPLRLYYWNQLRRTWKQAASESNTLR